MNGSRGQCIGLGHTTGAGGALARGPPAVTVAELGHEVRVESADLEPIQDGWLFPVAHAAGTFRFPAWSPFSMRPQMVRGLGSLACSEVSASNVRLGP